jgi:glucokinase
MNIYIGIDCGATNLRLGVFDKTGRLKYCSKTKSPLRMDPTQLAKVSMDLIHQIIPAGFDYQIAGIGVGTPGPIDYDNGWILPSANIHNSMPIDLKIQFDTVFNTSAYFDRDANVALMGEVWQGSASNVKDAVMLTLGTGIGGAIMAHGEVERGAFGKGGEIGHMFLEIRNSKFKIQNLPKCGLGHEGCLEALINSTQDLEEFATYLGYGLANIVDIFNPQKIVIGGGKLKMGDFLPQAIKVMKSQALKAPVDEVEVVYAKLKELSGVYGAAKLAIDQIAVQ